MYRCVVKVRVHRNKRKICLFSGTAQDMPEMFSPGLICFIRMPLSGRSKEDNKWLYFAVVMYLEMQK